MTALLLFGGVLLLYLGAECLIHGASRLAIGLGIPVLVVGLTIVSMGTSLPEAITSLIAQVIDGNGDIALANVIGSNIANIGLITGITALIHPLAFSSHVTKIDMPIMLITLLALILFMLPGSVNRISGAILFIALISYVYYRLKTGQPPFEEKELEKIKPKQEVLKDLFLIVIGIVLLILGGDSFLNGAVRLAKQFGISDRVIGLTIIAIGTSLPELATTLLATVRKHSEIAIGNIVGSNIFNTLFIVGAVAMIKPIKFSQNLLMIDCPVMLLFSVLLWIIMRSSHTIRPLHGLFFLIGYGIYVLYLVLNLPIDKSMRF